MDYHARAAEKLIEKDDLSAQEVVGLTAAALESRDQGNDALYEQSMEKAEQIIEGYGAALGKTYEDIELELSDLRGILSCRREMLEKAIEEAYGDLDDDDHELIEDLQLQYMYKVSNVVVDKGENVFPRITN